MSTVQLQMDEVTWKHAQQVANQRQSTVEALIKEIIDTLATMRDTEDPFLGMFAQEPELIDQIVASTMQSRENMPLRLSNG